jgi:hypothetical protein
MFPEIKWFYAGFQASTTVSMRCALFWDFTQRRMVLPYRRFGTTYQSHLDKSSSLNCLTSQDGIVPIGCPETSLRNYYSTLGKTPKEPRSQSGFMITKYCWSISISRIFQLSVTAPVQKHKPNWTSSKVKNLFM